METPRLRRWGKPSQLLRSTPSAVCLQRLAYPLPLLSFPRDRADKRLNNQECQPRARLTLISLGIRGPIAIIRIGSEARVVFFLVFASLAFSCLRKHLTFICRLLTTTTAAQSSYVLMRTPYNVTGSKGYRFGITPSDLDESGTELAKAF